MGSRPQQSSAARGSRNSDRVHYREVGETGEEFWSRLRLAVRRGLSKDAALAALTSTPAEMFGVADRMGTIAPDGSRIWSWPAAICSPRKRGFSPPGSMVNFTTPSSRITRSPRDLGARADRKTFPLIVEGELDKPDAKSAGEKVSLSTKDDAVSDRGPGKALRERRRRDSIIRTNRGRRDERQRRWPWNAKLDRQANSLSTKKPDEKPSALDSMLDFPENLSRVPSAAAPHRCPPALLIQGATVWTSGPQGTLQERGRIGDRGKIAGVGPGLKAPAGAWSSMAKEIHVTPGSSIAIRTPRSAKV